MKVKNSVLLLIVFLMLVSPCLAQSYKIVFIHTRSFYDSQTGITRLIGAISYCQKEEQNNYKSCVNQMTEPIIGDVTKSLAAYGKDRNMIIIDADSDYEEYCIIDGDVPDITKEFIDEYNRLHP